ncbi:hypothetical protein CFN78_18110 [Amycolatopsis antarctica]|uniref:non-specific serine/threonine protein kinase n=1 Tax=Amycolatopsis antarctica TaxID=1854586 RepID=A0A263D2N8_9PSEU|nr:serine/threonine-protein kinase [Amycolatopsis antarctica]OZM71746.1 hypothetical protein CFN78_18110 [Amycolatopsis antarctica]
MTGDGNGRIGIGSVVLGRYRLDEQIAAGGMGVLWRATDTVLDGVVALKRVPAAHLDDEQAAAIRQRTLREARLAARLRGHPNVVALYDVQVDDGDVWLVLEYVPSRSLAELLTEQGTIGQDEVTRIGIALAGALAAAHELGIQHRDVTPANVLVGAAGGPVKLADFGIAHSTGDARLTQPGAVIGTICYLAPEIARGGEPTPGSDVFSLGATLYAALEGTPPFGRDDNPLTMLRLVSTGIIRPPENAGPLRPLLLRLLELDPATRPDAATVRESLRRTCEPGEPSPSPPPAAGPAAGTGDQDPVTVAPPLSAAPEPAGRKRRVHGTWLAVAVVATVAAVLLTLTTVDGGDGGPGPAPAGEPGGIALPADVGAVVMGDQPETVDACPLLDPAALAGYGSVEIVRGSALFGCFARISGPAGEESVVGFEMSEPTRKEYDHSDDGTEYDLGGVQVYQGALEQNGPAKSCKGLIVLSDNSAFFATAYPRSRGERGPDPCALIAAANASAANHLAQRGVPHTDYAGAYSLSAYDSCDLVDDATLETVKDLNRASYYGEFAHWGCKWGTDPEDEGLPAVEVRFLLTSRERFADPGDQQPVTIAGRQAFRTEPDAEDDGNTCTIHLPQQDQPNAEGTFQVLQVQARVPETRDRQCGYAESVAAAAQAKLDGRP